MSDGGDVHRSDADDVQKRRARATSQARPALLANDGVDIFRREALVVSLESPASPKRVDGDKPESLARATLKAHLALLTGDVDGVH